MRKRVISLLLIIGVISAMIIIPTDAREANMFTSGDFKSGIQRWSTWSNDSSQASFSYAKDAGVDGSGCLKITNTGAVAASVFQYVDCKPGKTYMMSCDVKCENVGTENIGFILGYTVYDNSSNNIGEHYSSSIFGTSDWRTVNYIFKVTETPAKVAAGPRLWFSTGTVYIDNMKLVELADTDDVSSTYDLSLSTKPNRHTVDSLGCEWDPKIFLEINRNHDITEEDLVFIKQRMDTLGIHSVRMMVTPDWFEKTNDNDDPYLANPEGFDFQNDEMRSLFAQLKVCEELGIRVTLTWWGAPTEHWLAYENTGDWIGAPNNLDEMSENILYLLSYIRNELKYDCVKELILQNEPSYSFKVSGGSVDFEYYVEYYKNVRKRLDTNGMTDIVLVGADDSQHYGWYFKSYEALKDICGKFDSHNYAWSYDMPYLDVLAQAFVSDRTSISGDKPFYLGEFGDGTTVGAYTAESTETFGRGIYVASVVVNSFKAGAAGASYWPLHDIYYYENTSGGDNGGLMAQGLIGFKKDGQWSFRPTYYAYGLLCNYIPFGSSIYNIEGNTDHLVDTVAAKSPDGRWSILAVNRSTAEQTIKIATSDAISSVLNRYTFEENSLPTDGNMISVDGTVTPDNGIYTLSLPANSFVVLSNINMTIDEMELPTDAESELNSSTETETTATDTDNDPGTDIPEGETNSEPKQNGCKSSLHLGVSVTAMATLAGALFVNDKKKRQA